jgi:hypothetical protein
MPKLLARRRITAGGPVVGERALGEICCRSRSDAVNREYQGRRIAIVEPYVAAEPADR